MKQEPKYYLPDLSEFHVGFEYEIFEHGTWNKEVFHQCFFERMIDTNDGGERPFEHGLLPEDPLIRVKCLDRSDIEDCGWEYDNNAEPHPCRVPYDLPIAFAIDKQLETGELWMLYLYPEDQMVWIEFIKDCGGEGYIFKGTINNKSELKQIMSKLGIC